MAVQSASADRVWKVLRAETRKRTTMQTVRKPEARRVEGGFDAGRRGRQSQDKATDAKMENAAAQKKDLLCRASEQ